MTRICPVSEFCSDRVIDWLRLGPIVNLYAVYDLLREPENSLMQLVVEKNSIIGYLLTYLGLEHPVRILQGSDIAARLLLDEIPREKMVAFIDPSLLDRAKERSRSQLSFPSTISIY